MPGSTIAAGALYPDTGLQNIPSQTTSEDESDNRFTMIINEVTKVIYLAVSDCSIKKRSKKFPDFCQKLKESNSEDEVINSINSYFKKATSSDKCCLVIKTIRESMEKKDSFLGGRYYFYEPIGNRISGKYYKLIPLENNGNAPRPVAEGIPQDFDESKVQFLVEDIGQSSHVNVSPISEENISQETNLRSLAELKRYCENHSNEIDLLKADNDIFTALLEIYNGFPAITDRIKLGSQELEKPNHDDYDFWVIYEDRLLKEHNFLVSKKEEDNNDIVINNTAEERNKIVTADVHEPNVMSTQHSIPVSSDIISQAIKTIDTKKTIGERFFSFLANVFHHSAYIRRERKG